MLPAPTTEAVLIMAMLGAHTAPMTPKKCARFRSLAARWIGVENRKIAMLRDAVPGLDEARSGATRFLIGGCVLCPRRDDCPGPLM